MIELTVSPVFNVECPTCGHVESLLLDAKQFNTRCLSCSQEYEVSLALENHEGRLVLSVKTSKKYD